MRYLVPKKLETVLLKYIKQTYLPKRFANPKHAAEFNAMDVRFFARGVSEMSNYFTSDRNKLPKNYLNKKELLAGYLLYFVPTNFLKVQFCLDEINAKEMFKGLSTIKIADVGSGPGTASLACADYWRSSADQKLEITAIDQNTHALHDAKHIFPDFAGANASLHTVFSNLHSKNMSSALRGKYNVIIAANFLSEFKDVGRQEEALRVILERHLEENGVLIVVEPALRHTSRDLMKLRDRTLESNEPGSGPFVLAPCLHVNPCPMLSASHRDWCHMYLEWERPELIQKIDMMIGNRKDYLKFSYLIFSNQPAVRTNAEVCNVWRVVSSPMNSKGKAEILLCNETCRHGGLLRATRLDKDASAQNSDFDHVKRGQLVHYNGLRLIGKDSEFRIVY